MLLHAAAGVPPAPRAPRAPRALRPLRSACARRTDIRSGRLVVAAGGTPPPAREPPPEPAPLLGLLSLRAWAQSAPAAAARAYHSLRSKLAAAYEMHGKSARTAVQALLGGPDMWVSREELENRRAIAYNKQKIEEVTKFGEEFDSERRGKAAPSHQSQPRFPAAAPRPAPLVWPPVAADAAPASAITRMAAAEASAAAAAAWARTAAAREAAAEASAAERTERQAAVQHTGDAEAWEWAAAAWHAAHEALEAARQACPDSPAVREAEAAVAAARALKGQRQAWRDA